MTETAAAGPLVVSEDLGGGVWRITLNRPAKRNAMNRAARTALIDSLDGCRGAAKVIILTGSGTAFCAGVDLTEVAADDGSAAPPGPADRRAAWVNVQREIRHHPAIVIAAVNGFALGGGVTLINSSDLAIAAEHALIGMPEMGFGLYPGMAGPSTQLRLNAKRAAWLVLTADRVSGATAAEWGLVNLAVPADALPEEAFRLASRIARHDAASLEVAKQALREIPMHISDWDAALEYGESQRFQIRARTNALRSGLARYADGEPKPGSAD